VNEIYSWEMENLLRIKNGREAYEINPREKERKTERRALISFITQYIQIPIVHIYTQTFLFASTEYEYRKRPARRRSGRDYRITSRRFVSSRFSLRRKRSGSPPARILHITTVGP